MSMLPPVVVELQANGSKLTAGLQQAQKDLDNMAKSGASTFDKISGAAQKYGTAIGAAMTAAGAALQRIAGPMEQSRAILGQAIQNTGHDMSEFQGAIDTTISHMEHYGRTSADTQGALGKLTAALGDPSKALADMALVADLAAAKHISLSNAAGLVVKMTAGSGKVFKEFGINLADFGTGADAASQATEVLKLKLHGMADAAADTTQGKFDALRAKVTDVAAALGQKLAPVLVTAGPLLMGVSQAVPMLTKAFEMLNPTTLGIAAVIGGALLVFRYFSERAAEAAKRVDDLRGAMKDLNATASEAAASKLTDFVAKNRQAAQAAGDASVSIDDLRSAITSGGDAMSTARGKLNDLIAALDKKRLMGDANAAQEEGAARQLLTQLDQEAAAVKSVMQQDAQSAAVKQQVTTATLDLADADRQRKQSTDAVKDAAELTAAAEKVHSRILADEAAAQKNAADQAKRLADNQDQVARKTKEAYDAAQNAINPVLGYRASVRDLADAVRDETDKVKEAAAAKGRDAEKNEALQAAQDNLLGKIVDSAQKFAEQSGAVAGSTQSYDLQITKLAELRSTYGDKLGGAAKDLDTLIQKLKDAEAATKNLNNTAAGYGGYRVAGVAGGNIQMKASGGPVYGGTPYVVGEEGPELFVPHVSGFIVPNGASAGSPGPIGTGGSSGSSGGTGSVVINLTVNAGMGTDGATLGRQILDALKAAVRVNGYGSGSPILV